MRKIELRPLALAGGMMAAVWTGAAVAQPAPVGQATDMPGVVSAPPPPARFDAINAGDADLATYGFPPRPDRIVNPTGYAHWAAAVSADHKRLVPKLQSTIIRHGPHIPASPTVIDGNATSTNWSGYVSQVAAKSFVSNSFNSIAGNLVVPSVATRTCDGNWEYSSTWVGIDGYYSDDVLQAGVEADAECASQTTQTFFSAWYEWYPNYETRITNLTAEPGQSLYVHVWATSATAGHAYLTNLNTNQSVSLSFSAPSGTRLIGNSAAWVVESPTVGSSLATLPLYGLDYFSGSTSQNSLGKTHVPGGTYATALTLERNGTAYSVPGLLGTTGVLMTSH